MPIRNAHFYDQNSGRAYPVDDAASCMSDGGLRLPPDLLVDANLRWPSTLGKFAFVAAIANTSALVTVTLQAATAIDDTDSFTPLAVLSVKKPVQIGRMYAVQPQVPGVGGWLVFGQGVNGEEYRGRFSTPQQSALTSRTARAYSPLPVSSLQAQHANDVLTGVITLKVSEPLAIAKEERFIAGANRDCIVVRLVDGTSASGFPVPSDASEISGFKPTSLFLDFAGPCAGRPESNTCGCPTPIEFVNAVSPTCDGVLTIEFQGCAQLASVSDGSGVAIACELGLIDACLPPQIPSSDGLLPSEYTPANVPIPPDVPPPPPSGSSDTLLPLGSPYIACSGGGESDLHAVYGEWAYTDTSSPTSLCTLHAVSESLSTSHTFASGSYQANTASLRNVAIFNVDVSAVYRKATIELMMIAGPTGAKQNGQLIINYRPHATIVGEYVYWAAELDYDTQKFKIVRFNSTTFQVLSSVTVPGIQLDKWYRLTATVLPLGDYGSVVIDARVESMTDIGVTDQLLSATISNYQPSTGKFGAGTNRAIAAFSYLKIEEAP